MKNSLLITNSYYVLISAISMDLFGSSSDEEEESLITSTTQSQTPSHQKPQRPRENGVMQFHTGTEQALLVYVTQHASGDEKDKGNSPEDILRLVDSFCEERHWMMHIGSLKVEILRDALHKRMATFSAVPSSSSPQAPLILLELGTYCGYSAVQLCSLLKRNYPSQPFLLYSLEIDEKNARVAREIIRLSGFSSNVKVFVAHDVEDGLVEVTKDLGLPPSSSGPSPFVDLLFIDHDKDSYLSDLRLVISNGYLKSDAVVIADNVIMGRIDDYLDFVRGEAAKADGLFTSSRLFESTVEYCEQDVDQWGEDALKDGVEVSVFR